MKSTEFHNKQTPKKYNSIKLTLISHTLVVSSKPYIIYDILIAKRSTHLELCLWFIKCSMSAVTLYINSSSSMLKFVIFVNFTFLSSLSSFTEIARHSASKNTIIIIKQCPSYNSNGSRIANRLHLQLHSIRPKWLGSA